MTNREETALQHQQYNMKQGKSFSKPLTIWQAVVISLSITTMISLFIFSVISLFNSFWIVGCAILFIMFTALLTFFFYDISQDDENSEDNA